MNRDVRLFRFQSCQASQAGTECTASGPWSRAGRTARGHVLLPAPPVPARDPAECPGTNGQIAAELLFPL